MIIPTAIAICIAPIYLLSHRLTLVIAGFTLQGLFGQAIYGRTWSWPDRLRAIAAPSAAGARAGAAAQCHAAAHKSR